jgi:aspartate/glutamate racemase
MFQEINTHLDALHLDGIILGCTELPMIFKGPKFIDPTQILAKACIRKSGHKLKKSL